MNYTNYLLSGLSSAIAVLLMTRELGVIAIAFVLGFGLSYLLDKVQKTWTVCSFAKEEFNSPSSVTITSAFEETAQKPKTRTRRKSVSDDKKAVKPNRKKKA